MRPLLIAFGVMSLISLAVYGADKARAQSRRWRIPESCLLLLGFLGGAAGALLGMLIFRHKTRRWYFWAGNLASLAWQLTALYVSLS